MTIYVDDAFIPGVPNGKAWRQMRPSGVHYDVTLGVRAKAVRAGAVELEAGTPEWRRVAKQARIQYWEDRLL